MNKIAMNNHQAPSFYFNGNEILLVIGRGGSIEMNPILISNKLSDKAV